MKEILFSRAANNLCPICNKQINKEIVITACYNKTDLFVCKTHIKYGEENEKKNNS